MSTESEFLLNISSENHKCWIVATFWAIWQQAKENFTPQNYHSFKKASKLKQITFEGVSITDTKNNVLNLQNLIRILLLILMEKSFYLQCSVISIFYNLSLNQLTWCNSNLRNIRTHIQLFISSRSHIQKYISYLRPDIKEHRLLSEHLTKQNWMLKMLLLYTQKENLIQQANLLNMPNNSFYNIAI